MPTRLGSRTSSEAELEYAGARGPLEEQLFETLARVPSPGVFELAAEARVLQNGGESNVVVTRTKDGGFEVQLDGSVDVGLRAIAGVHVGGGVGATWKVQTPEAAADLLQSVVLDGLSRADPSWVGRRLSHLSRVRVEHYSAAHLAKLKFDVHGSVGLRTELPVMLAAASLTGAVQVTLDFATSTLVLEQRLEGEAVARGGVLVAAAGLEGEVSAALVLELPMSPTVLRELSDGHRALPDVVAAFPVHKSVRLTAEGQGEVLTAFGEGSVGARSIEVEVDLEAWAADPLHPASAMKGSVKSRASTVAPFGLGVELPGLSAKLSVATSAVSEAPLFSPDELQRLTSSQGRRTR